MKQYEKVKYYATSKDMQKEIPSEINHTGYWLEFNPNVGMWRLNNNNGVPMELAGYNPHKPALIQKVLKYVR